MKTIPYLCATFLAGIMGAIGMAGDNLPKVNRLEERDLDKTPQKSNEVRLSRPGDIVQFNVSRPFKKDQVLRTLKVDVEGDALKLVAIVELNRFYKASDGNVAQDTYNKHLACILKAEKEGKHKVKVTPIGEDGKDRPSREWIVYIGRSNDPADVKPSTKGVKMR